MAPFNLRHRFRSRQFTRPSTPSGRRRVRPQLEICEDRTLLATFNVTDFNDVVNLNDGKWSLREAVNEANSNNEADTINLQAGKYTLTQGSLVLSKGSVTVNGANTTNWTASVVSGNNASRVWEIKAGVTATFNGITIQDGRDGFGGAGIFNDGTLSLNKVSVARNLTQAGKAPAAQTGSSVYGGAINNTSTGQLRLTNSEVVSNQAIAGDGGDSLGTTLAAPGGLAWGGGILNGGSLTLVNTEIASNLARGGLGGTNSDVLFTLLGVDDLRAMSGEARGGGIANYQTTGVGVTDVDTDSVIRANQARGWDEADGSGGGVYVDSGAVTIRGLVDGNAARGGNGTWGRTRRTLGATSGQGGTAGKDGGAAGGGGVYLANGTLDLLAARVTNNRAIGGDGGKGGEGGAGYNGNDLFDNNSSAINGQAGGNGGRGGAGGFAGGGGVYQAGGTLTATGGSFTGNQAIGGSGHLGGNGGNAGNGSSDKFYRVTPISLPSAINGGNGGNGGRSGDGGAGGFATGGAVAQAGGQSSYTGTDLSGNTVTGGQGQWGGWAGASGAGGNGTAAFLYQVVVDLWGAVGGGNGGRGGDAGNGGRGGDAGGGGVAVGGSGRLTLSHSLVSGNVARGGGAGGGRGGWTGGNGGNAGDDIESHIYAFTDSGGRGGDGGNGGSGGTGGYAGGGGVFQIGGTILVNNTTIAANTLTAGASGDGGGAGNGGRGGNGTSRVSGTGSGGDGGNGGNGGTGGNGGNGGFSRGAGIYSTADRVSLNLLYATVAGNAAGAAAAGGARGDIGFPGVNGVGGPGAKDGRYGGPGTRSYVGVDGALEGAGLYAPAGAGGGSGHATSQVRNSIIGGNSPATAADVAGTVTSSGGNVVQVVGTATGFNGPNDLTGADPKLVSLGNYGGPTKSMPPRADSPAVNRGVAVGNETTDQRGLLRTAGGGPDSGAAESQPAASYAVTGPASVVAGGSNTYTIVALDDDGSRVYGYTSGVRIRSSDPGALFPADSDAGLFDGVGSFDARLLTAGMQTLTVTEDGGSISGTVTVIVTPAAFDRLVFGQQPSNAIANQPIAPTVTVRATDQYGNTVTTQSGTVALSLDYNPTNATLLNKSAALVNGVATFPSLTVDRPSGRYTLAASGVGTVTPKSSDFAVAPAIVRRASGSATVNQGTPYTLALEATGGTIQTWTINWGDGTTENFPGSATSAVHTFTTPITRTITVSATDSDGVVRQAVYNRRNYIADFQGGSPASGWSYLWNKNGPIGTPANYVPLVWSPTVYGGTYVVDEGQWPSSGPGSYALLGPNWGHPGAGSGQGVGYDRTVIAAFTAPQAGTYRIMDGTIDRNSGAVDGSVEVYIYKNSTLLRRVSDITGPNSWSSDPVTMAAGDTLYAAVSPQGGDGYDTFQWDFAVARTDGVSLSVTNVAPALSPPAPQGFTPGSPKLFSLGSFSDVSGDGPWKVDVVWGDGSPVESFTVNSTGTLPTRLHTYAGEGPYTILVTVADSRNAAKQSSFSIKAFTRVTIDQAPNQADPTSSTPVLFRVVFSSPVSGFQASSINLSGTALPTNAIIDGGSAGTIFTVLVTGMTRRGDVIATVAGNAATDSFGVKSLASTSTDNRVNFNRPPSSLDLDGGTIAENSPGGTVVGILSSSDPDVGDTAFYDVPNDPTRFMTIGDKLIVRNGAILDFEATPTITVPVRVTDGGGLTLTKNFVINLTNVNEMPTSLTLSGGTIAENSTGGTLLGVLSSTDPDAGDSAAYSLLNDGGGRFELIGDKILVKPGAVLDFETTPTLNITAQVTDSGGLTLTRDFVVSLINLNESAAFVVQNGETQRSLVRVLTLDFDGGAGLTTLLTPGRVALTRVRPDGVTEQVPLTGVLSLVGNRLTFDFGKTGLADGRYTLAVDADGDGVRETTKSFHRLFGDSDGDGDVDASDYRTFVAAYKRPTVYAQYWYFDADGDGIISEADLLAFRSRFGTRI